MLANKTHWIFDLDGTLTEAIHDFDAIRAMLGAPASDGILEWLTTLPTAERTALERLLDEHEYELAGRAVAAQGALETLSTLVNTGCRVGIATRNNARNVAITLRTTQLARFFPASTIMTRENTLPKPNPDGILQLMGLWNSNPDQVVMVGNHLHDLAAGRAAGVSTIHVDVTGEFPWPEAADLRVTTLVDLKHHGFGRG
jgi:HAD superfamily hydrolase (TIGR01509 family)